MWKGRGENHAGGETHKIWRAAPPWRWGQGHRPWSPGGTLSPAPQRRKAGHATRHRVEHVPRGGVGHAKPSPRAKRVGARCAGPGRLAGRGVASSPGRGWGGVSLLAWRACSRPPGVGRRRAGHGRRRRTGQRAAACGPRRSLRQGSPQTPSGGSRGVTLLALQPRRLPRGCGGCPSTALAPAHPAGRRARLQPLRVFRPLRAALALPSAPKGSPNTNTPQPGQAQGECSGQAGSCCQGQALRVLAGSPP